MAIIHATYSYASPSIGQFPTAPVVFILLFLVAMARCRRREPRAAAFLVRAAHPGPPPAAAPPPPNTHNARSPTLPLPKIDRFGNVVA